MSLSLFEFAAALEIFNGKILLIAVAVFLLTGFLKRWVSEKFRKYVTLLPFLLGVLLYGAYLFFLEDINPLRPETLSTGLQCGVAATIYYVVYDQFFKSGARGRQAVLTALVAAVVPKERLKDALKNVLAALDEKGADTARKLYDILTVRKSADIAVEDVMSAVKNITNI